MSHMVKLKSNLSELVGRCTDNFRSVSTRQQIHKSGEFCQPILKLCSAISGLLVQ